MMEDEWINALGDEDQINPEPIIFEETELLVNDFLSVSKLQKITGEDDLRYVKTLEMVVNTTETTLGNFGQYLPKLMQLKLSHSNIPSVRDIGTSLNNLSVLWMSRCSLCDVNGITSLQNLQELYVAYNNIDDISPISFLDSLEVLDLEGNMISSVEQIDYLSMMSSLNTLTLTGNLIVKTYKEQSDTNSSFRQFVLGKIPTIKQLDDKGVDSDKDHSHYRPEIAASSNSQEDVDIVTAAIKEGVVLEIGSESTVRDSSSIPMPSLHCQNNVNSSNKELLPLTFSLTPKLTLARPATANARRSPAMTSQDPILFSPSVLQTRPGSSGSESGMLQQDDSSSLTFGDPICGNPIHALRNRKKSPLPAMSLITPKNFNPRYQPRPSTTSGYQKLTLDQNFETVNSKMNVPSNFKALNLNSQTVEKPNAVINTNQRKVETQNGVLGKSSVPSPPHHSNVSPARGSSTIISPSPPHSPQRPQTACDFRAHQFRRSYVKQALNPLSISSGGQRFRHRNLVHMKGKD
ncbi:uncharacterized protein LOC100176462 [Ciona intestinalis]